MAEGKLNPREQARLEEQKKSRKTRMKYVAVALALFLMIALVVFVNSSLFTDGLAALKVGDTGYSVADVNYEYQSSYRQLLSTYGDYISIFLDPEKPLDEQQCAMMSDGGTWDDYFKDMAERRQNVILVDWAPDSDRLVSATRDEARVAANVTWPPVSALPTVTMSGAMPARECAQSGPVRWKPAAISSKMSSAPVSSQRRRISRRYPAW